MQFQKQFLHSLEQAVEQEAPSAAESDDAARFKVLHSILYSVSFLFQVAVDWHTRKTIQ